MKLNHPVLDKLGGLLASAAVRSWMSTLDYKAAMYDPAVDPARPECQGKKVYIFWHEYILFPLHLRGHCNLAMLLSRHRDAEILSRVAYHLGFDFVRGSTNRGGVMALRELWRRGREMHLAITPDGPRGPRRRLAPGAIYLASRLGLPLVPFGCGYDRPWRLGSWDRFAIPRPASRARAVVSTEIHIPPQLDRAGVEHFRVKVERLLNRLTDEAEAWAATPTRKLGQYIIGPGYARSFLPTTVGKEDEGLGDMQSRRYASRSMSLKSSVLQKDKESQIVSDSTALFSQGERVLGIAPRKHSRPAAAIS